MAAAFWLLELRSATEGKGEEGRERVRPWAFPFLLLLWGGGKKDTYATVS